MTSTWPCSRAWNVNREHVPGLTYSKSVNENSERTYPAFDPSLQVTVLLSRNCRWSCPPVPRPADVAELSAGDGWTSSVDGDRDEARSRHSPRRSCRPSTNNRMCRSRSSELIPSLRSSARFSLKVSADEVNSDEVDCCNEAWSVNWAINSWKTAVTTNLTWLTDRCDVTDDVFMTTFYTIELTDIEIAPAAPYQQQRSTRHTIWTSARSVNAPLGRRISTQRRLLYLHGSLPP